MKRRDEECTLGTGTSDIAAFFPDLFDRVSSGRREGQPLVGLLSCIFDIGGIYLSRKRIPVIFRIVANSFPATKVRGKSGDPLQPAQEETALCENQSGRMVRSMPCR